MKDLLFFINRALRPIKSRLSAMIGRGVLKLVNDAKMMQLDQVDFLDEETGDDLEHFQQYGFTNNPQPGAEVLAFFPQGNREHGIIVAIADRRFRLKGLAPGEVALYTDEGDTIHFKRGNNLEVQTKIFKVTATEKIEMISPLVTMSQAAEIGATLKVTGLQTNLAGITATGAIATAAGVTAAGPVIGAGVTDTATGATIASVKSTFNTHTHNENGTGGGVTNPPNSAI